MAMQSPDVEALEKVQSYIFPRRVRVKEYFKDFDSLRCGRCTKAQFARALRMIGMHFAPEEVDALASRYYKDSQPRVTPRAAVPQEISYDAFCEEVDTVFVSGTPRNKRTMAKQDGHHDEHGDDSPERELLRILVRMGMLVRTRGIALKACFKDFDKSPRHSPAQTTPRFSGKATVAQFMRQFPFRKDLQPREMDLLVEHYQTETGDVDFWQLHNDVEHVMGSDEVALKTSPYIARPDTAEWSHQSLDVVEKIRSKVVEKRVRLYEHFQDFDALRKGFCTVGQVKTVFTIANMTKEVDKLDFEQLALRYMREDGMFCYADFCADIDSAFVVPGLEKDPLVGSKMPDASTTAPARRNRMHLTEVQHHKIDALEEKIRQRVRVRRVLMLPVFRDLDKRSNAGPSHVTRSQFTRVMCMLAFELDEKDIDLLCRTYCDMGNRTEFNYLDFCMNCDPADEQLKHSARLACSPRMKESTGANCRYFNSRGFVRPVG